ncbi:Pathogenesis-related protein 1 [Cocos nucifera]|uniref:Pathogenesis-related protein 1 n=1 Tax=Cocos nucifera TaxID=13894 RepID=A0A8K0IYD7_COCNU|nr:Pathogenesis-related protein 1 [Cocos nucifera]
MSTSSWSHEIESPVPAARLFKAAVLDWHNLAPMLIPEIVVSAAGIEGDGGVGSVRQFQFSSGIKAQNVDFDKLECKQSPVEGGDIGTKIESASSHFKLETSSNGGCVCKVVATYKLLPGVEVKDEITKAKETLTGIFRAAEAYLLANPASYA